MLNYCLDGNYNRYDLSIDYVGVRDCVAIVMIWACHERGGVYGWIDTP